MKNCFYAAYDLRGQEELCLGTWKTVRALARDLGLGERAVYRNLAQTRRGRSYSRSKISINRFRK